MTIPMIPRMAKNVNEESDCEFDFTFAEASIGQPQIQTGAIQTIKATLKNVKDWATINSRADQDVKDVAGGSLDANGLFTLHLTGNVDNVIVVPEEKSGELEEHSLTLKVVYFKTGGGDGFLTHEVRFFVKQLRDVV